MATAVDAAVSAGASEVFCGSCLRTQPKHRCTNEPLSTIPFDSEGDQWQHALVMFAAFCQRGQWLLCAEIAVPLSESLLELCHVPYYAPASSIETQLSANIYRKLPVSERGFAVVANSSGVAIKLFQREFCHLVRPLLPACKM